VQFANIYAAPLISPFDHAGSPLRAGRQHDALRFVIGPVLHSVSRTGFFVDPDPSLAVGDALALVLARGDTIEARVVGLVDGRLRCDFVYPIDASRLAAARAGGQVLRMAPNDTHAAGQFWPDAPYRWPRAARAAIAIGGAAALWGMIGMALR
jgi:hypothetical protein